MNPIQRRHLALVATREKARRFSVIPQSGLGSLGEEIPEPVEADEAEPENETPLEVIEAMQEAP